MRCAKVQVQEEAADNWETISDEVCQIQNVRECIHWKSMNLSEQTWQKDCCNSVWHDWVVQIRTTILGAALSAIS